MAAGSLALADAHRLTQQKLGIQTIRLLHTAFPLLDIQNLDATTGRWLEATVNLVRVQHLRSARMAGDYLTAARALDLGVDSPLVPVLAIADIEQITTSLRVTGPIRARELGGAGRTLTEIRQAVFTASSRAGMRHALAGGRNTITGTTARDRKGGWARVTSGDPCAFCAMLASRGPVYSQATVRFRAHDGCSCSAMAVYNRRDGWTGQARGYRDLWNDVATGATDPLNAFRRALKA
jgi:hypothetical protein